MLRVIPLRLALLYRYYPLTWKILWLTFYYCYCSCFLFLFLYCYGKMHFFIHCNFFCQKYKFIYLLTYLLYTYLSKSSLLTFSVNPCNNKIGEWTEKKSLSFLKRKHFEKFYWPFLTFLRKDATKSIGLKLTNNTRKN